MAESLFDNLKKTVYAGVGLIFLTRDKLEEAARKIAEEARLSESEGKKFVDDLLRRSEEARKSLDNMVNGAVNRALERLDLPRRSEIKALEARIAKLEERAAQEKPNP